MRMIRRLWSELGLWWLFRRNGWQRNTPDQEFDWTGAGDGKDWWDVNNWNQDQPPGRGAMVTFAAGAQLHYEITGKFDAAAMNVAPDYKG